MSSSNVLYYCKYYRINVSYCILKNRYPPLYRKIKSLLYIQLMTGVRRLAWQQDYNIHTHNGRTLWFVDIYRMSMQNAYIHTYFPACTAAAPTHISFFPDISPLDMEIQSKYSTNHEHGLEGYFSKGKFRNIHISQFPLPNTYFAEYSCYVIRNDLGSEVLSVTLQPSLLNLHLETSQQNNKNLVWKVVNNDRNIF